MKVSNSVINKRIKGGAMQLVTAMAILLFSLMGLFLLRKYITSQIISYAQIKHQLVNNVTSCLNLTETINTNDIPHLLNVELSAEHKDKTTIRFKPWGIFHTCNIQTQIQHLTTNATFLLGYSIKDKQKVPSLYMSNSSAYLSLGGNTILGNDSYVPRYGLRRAYINGKTYNRNNLTLGETYTAADRLPKLNHNFLNNLGETKDQARISSKQITLADLNNLSTVCNSFLENTLFLDIETDYTLSNIKIYGNVVLTCSGHLKIDPSVVLENCIVIADSLTIAPFFKGRAQFFVKRSFRAGKTCKFEMPTTISNLETKSPCKIILEENCTLLGFILLQTPIESSYPLLSIGKGCKLAGQVYCNTYCNFSGTLLGSLYTIGFLTPLSGTFKKNYLLDTYIDSHRMPSEIRNLSLVEKNTNLKAIDKLY